MVNDFLRKYQEELITQKIQLKEDMDLLETKIKEETKFLNLLEESNESYFVEFTPRDINEKNNKKAEEVRLNLKDLNSQMDEKIKKMRFFDGRLVELNALLTNSVAINKPSSTNKTVNPVRNNSSDLINRLNNLKNVIVLDPYKAKIDLENIISDIEKDI
ncbi:hypothetical protein SAMN05660668_01494 [Pseudobutyrivibrio sp. AR14]|uniref:hypothetical protein n=1 Tax=Pseudobutyrivibrio sp. AR14 TaxID=1520804 RepID=UPI0008910257|nr:hypothetical protein [Pseudobutyrivibrio sp. AR14]SCY11573.1 hypothetical protein SAMN05660668_01494 [Pseudobutyrivibrio sp. AR14]